MRIMGVLHTNAALQAHAKTLFMGQVFNPFLPYSLFFLLPREGALPAYLLLKASRSITTKIMIMHSAGTHRYRNVNHDDQARVPGLRARINGPN